MTCDLLHYCTLHVLTPGIAHRAPRTFSIRIEPGKEVVLQRGALHRLLQIAVHLASRGGVVYPFHPCR